MELISTLKVAQDAILAREAADAAVDAHCSALLTSGWGTRSYTGDHNFNILWREFEFAKERAEIYKRLPGVKHFKSEAEILAAQ